MESVEEMRAELVQKACSDDDFRARLLANPNGAIEEAMGVAVPQGFSVSVLEDTRNTFHLVLPPSERLTGEELASVSGGRDDNEPW